MITLVSGLPRSGTSMMMQMLESGGLSALTDRVRVADDDNPRGYFEFEPVKQLKDDASWLPRAEGKAVKIISMLLFHLPPEFEYRVVFMKRPIREILASQKRMLERQGLEPGEDDSEMRSHFESHLEKIGRWMRQQPNVKVYYCNYHKVLAKPREISEDLCEFLGGALDLDKMVEAVDPDLYRQKG